MKLFFTLFLYSLSVHAIDCSSLLHSFFESKEQRVLNGRGPIKLGQGWGGTVYLERDRSGKLVTRKVYKADIVREGHALASKDYHPRSLLDLEALEILRDISIELKNFKVINVISSKRYPAPGASHMQGLIVFLEYVRGVDLKRLWQDKKLTPEVVNKYNELIESIANYLRKKGSPVEVIEAKLYDDLKLLPSGMKGIIDEIKIGDYNNTIMLKPDNFLLTEDGSLVLIDPY